MSRAVGNEAETLAAEALVADGYDILERNFLCRAGEIDIVAREGGCICFVEVKYRNPRGFGIAADNITRSKMRKILLTARKYLQENDLLESDYRIDAVAIDGTNIDILKDVYMAGMDGN